jgi:hypothetical protein
MPFVFLIFGILFLVVAVRGTQDAFFGLIRDEFTGPGNFVVWVLAIIVLGALGYIRAIRPVADAFVGLIILAMVLNNKGGVVTQFQQAVKNPVSPPGGTGGQGAAKEAEGNGFITGGGIGSTPSPNTDPAYDPGITGGGAATTTSAIKAALKFFGY